MTINPDPQPTMEVYVHSEDSHDPQLIEVSTSGQVGDLLTDEESLWMQDEDDPLPVDVSFPEAGVIRRSHIHRGRCDKVKVQVRHAGEELFGEFSPAARVVRVFDWTTGPEGFKLPTAQIPKFGLKLPNGDEFLDFETHVGSLVSGSRCVVTMDLVPKDRPAG